MKRSTCLLLSFALVASAAHAGGEKPGELTDPLEILKKADAAAKDVKAVRFDVATEPTGAMVARAGTLTGSVIMKGYLNGAPEKFFFDFNVTVPNTDTPRRVTGGSDNDMFYVIDHQGKIAYEDIDPSVMGVAGNIFRQVQTIEFLHHAPFSDEINGKSRALKGHEKIGDQDCYIVHVVYAAERAPEATWFFSKKDFLPRRRIDTRTMQDGQTGTISKTITNLVVDPEIDDSVFKLKLPKGYTKTDDFSPNFLAPPPQPAEADDSSHD